jgi:all-trans-retinol 13,14-reductase
MSSGDEGSGSRRDPDNHRAAPAGSSTIEVQSITPASPQLWGFDPDDIESGAYRHGAKYREIKKIVSEGMTDRMEQAFPGSSSAIVLHELGTPATQARFVGNDAPFGLECIPTQLGPMRTGPTTSFKGLYLVGTSTPWGPATEGAMISGQQVAGLIVGRDLGAEAAAGAVLADRTRLRDWGSDFDPLHACRGFRDGSTSAELDDDPID